MERLLLLWDELDEIVGYGRHLAADLSAAVAQQGQMLRRRLRVPAANREAANPLN
ncbi:MAG: hypothetical protein ABIQ86_16835 [Steroidobacteraceae bacterium]